MEGSSVRLSLSFTAHCNLPSRALQRPRHVYKGRAVGQCLGHAELRGAAARRGVCWSHGSSEWSKREALLHTKVHSCIL